MRVAYLCLQATREGQASHAHVHEIIKGLRQRNWQVDLYEPDYAYTNQRLSLHQKIKEFMRVQKSLATRLRNHEYDIVYIRLHPLSFLTSRRASRYKIPTVVEVNGLPEELYIAYPASRYLSWLWEPLTCYGIRSARAVIAVTMSLVMWARNYLNNDQVFWIPNGANTELFRPTYEPLPSSLRKPYALFFGALAPWQGIDVMLAAVNHPAWPDRVSLAIAGDGVERPRVVEAATHSPRIIYLETISYTKMPIFISQSLCGLIPKSHQVHKKSGLMPLKLFETLACSVPAIVSDYPGMADLVRQGECGIVIPPDDPAALANAVRHLYEQPELRAEMGRRGRELIVREHSWDARAEATHQVLLQVLTR